MKKKVWQIAIAALCCLLLYRLIAGCQFGCLGRLSVNALVWVSILALLFLAAEVFYLHWLLSAAGATTRIGMTMAIYCTSHVIGTFSTYYLGLASFIVILKNVSRTTYSRALSCTLADLAIRYSPRGLFAVFGAVFLFAPRQIPWIAGGGVIVGLLCVVFKDAALTLLGEMPLPARVLRKGREMMDALAGFSRKHLAYLLLTSGLQLFLESLIFAFILRQFGYEYSLLLVLSIRSIGIFIGYASLFATLSIVEDLSVIGLWTLVGIDASSALLAVAINRLVLTIIPALLSLPVAVWFFSKKPYLRVLILDGPD